MTVYSVYQNAGPILGGGDSPVAAWADCKHWGFDVEDDPNYGHVHRAHEYQGLGCLEDVRTDMSDPDWYDIRNRQIVDPPEPD